MKNKFLLYTCVVIAFLAIIIPFIIYRIFYYWTASDMLTFYGSCLSFIGSTVLGYVAITQSNKSNELSQKMLELEETQNAPIIDIARCSQEAHELPNNELRNALKVCINDSFVYFNSNNSVLECSDTIDLFEIKNISNTNIMQLKIIEISQSTIYQNGECFLTNIESLSSSIPVIMPKDETRLFCILGIEYNGPKDMNEEMKLELDYIMPQIEVEITFSLINDKGTEYIEKIRINYFESFNDQDIQYPIIFDKKILELKKLNNC